MRVGLFVPCYVDQLYPGVAVATLGLLENLRCEVVYPRGQTCCGQPLANAGYEATTRFAARHFVKQFDDVDYVVSPSASCVLHIRDHYNGLVDSGAAHRVRSKVHEVCEFLTDVAHVDRLDASFPHRVGVHIGCHGLRGLHLGTPSELVLRHEDRVRMLLDLVRDIEIVGLSRHDECCGFGGSFSVTEATLSARIGRDRLQDYLDHGAEYIAGTDMSCLMHIEGLARREGLPICVVHVVEILNGGVA